MLEIEPSKRISVKEILKSRLFSEEKKLKRKFNSKNENFFKNYEKH